MPALVQGSKSYYYPSPKTPCAHIVGTLASKGSLNRYFTAEVPTLWVHGAFGLIVLVRSTVIYPKSYSHS